MTSILKFKLNDCLGSFALKQGCHARSQNKRKNKVYYIVYGHIVCISYSCGSVSMSVLHLLNSFGGAFCMLLLYRLWLHYTFNEAAKAPTPQLISNSIAKGKRQRSRQEDVETDAVAELFVYAPTCQAICMRLIRLSTWALILNNNSHWTWAEKCA